MRFLIDAQLPATLQATLHTFGHEAVHVQNALHRSADDDDIADFAIDRDLILITKDADFHLIARRNRGLRVIWLRIGNVGKAELAGRLASVWPDVVGQLEAGATLIEVR